MQYSRRNGALMTLTVAESARHLSPKRVRVPEWPATWVTSLTGPAVAYRAVRERLMPAYPELQPRVLSPAAIRAGLRHVPQAAYFDPCSRAFRAYSPLSNALGQVAAKPLRITQ